MNIHNVYYFFSEKRKTLNELKWKINYGQKSKNENL